MTTERKEETRVFEAETSQLLDLMIHALYTHKEIFLRELISNASDAVDKLRFESLSQPEMLEDKPDFKIFVKFDAEANTVTVSDNGIGMDYNEVINNIGKIAESGTKKFKAALSGDQAKDAQLIGKFGVGFYSAFIVADKVTLITRRAGLDKTQGVKWESTGRGNYTIGAIETAERGTSITLHLKETDKEFANYSRLHHIIHRYSDHIATPILMDKNLAQATFPGKDKEKQTTVEESQPNWETINHAAGTPIWARASKDISETEYLEFYKQNTHDFEDPLVWTHNKVEGRLEYTNLLYIPSHAPFDLWIPQQHPHGVKLYVNRVLIMDDVNQFLPSYLRFVRGIVDSNDLSLNISRETLQHNTTVQKMRSALTKRILDLLIKTSETDTEKYITIWKHFGKVLKEGIAEDFQNQSSLVKLLRFASTHSNTSDQIVTLDAYVDRMQVEQKQIYYVTATDFQSAQNSPHLEIFKKKGIEVLLLSDPIDEWLVAHLPPFKEKSFQSIAQGNLDLGELDDKSLQDEQKKQETEFASLIKQITSVLGEKIKEARITHRLTESPACVVTDTKDIPLNMQRILKSMGRDGLPESKPIFEINPNHPLIQHLNSEADDQRFAEWTEVLFNQAVLAESGRVDNPAGFVSQLNRLLSQIYAI
jgi:molecular chaperone HtpG